MKPGPLPSTRTITVYRNGDGYFPGRKIVLTSRLSSLEGLLDLLTSVRSGSGQDAQFGAVRRLYSVQGQRVRRLGQVEAGRGYVAAGNERFKHLCYLEITTRRPQTKAMDQVYPVMHSRIQASSRWGKSKDGTCTIHVYTNGEVLAAPVRIRIPKYTMKSWESVLAMVTDKVSLRSGAVHRLCTVDGRPLSGPSQLRNLQHYVAVGAERFKALPYDQRLQNRPLSSKNSTYESGRRKSKTHNLWPQICLKEEGSGQMRAAKRQILHVSSVLSGSVFTAQRRRSELVGATEVQEDGWLSMRPSMDQEQIREVHSSTKGSEGTGLSD